MNSKSWKTDEEEEGENDDSKNEKESMAKEVFTRVNPILNFNLTTPKDEFAFPEGSYEISTHLAHAVGKRYGIKKEKDLNNLNVLEGKRAAGDGEEAHLITEEEYLKDGTNNGTGANKHVLKDEQQDLTKGHVPKMLEHMVNMEQIQIARLQNIQMTQMCTMKRQDVIETDLEEIKKTSMRVENRLERWEQKFSMQHAIPKPVFQRGDNLRDEDICTSLHCPCPCRHRPALSDHRNNSDQDKNKNTARRRKQFKTSTGGDGGGSSGDDSSSESDDGEYNKRSSKAPRNRPGWDQWKDAIDHDDVWFVRYWIKRGILPHYFFLKRAFVRNGDVSEIVKTICDGVVRFVVKTNMNVISVMPAYCNDNPNDIVFVAYRKSDTLDLGVLEERGYHVEPRVINRYNCEGKEIARKEEDNDCVFTENDLERVANCLKKHSENLFEKHTNLQMISPSHYRSSGFEKESDASIENCLCIVLYVSVKGYIPLCDEQFPSELDGIPTDVREGGFEFLSNAKDRHANLKMGCQITGDNKKIKRCGSIGPFFEEYGDTYFVTSSHVLFDLGMIPKNVVEYEWQATEKCKGPTTYVYQPSSQDHEIWSGTNNPVGNTYWAFYKKGTGDIPGMEVAVVKITDPKRKPVSCEFPDSEDEPMETLQGSHSSFAYETGGVVEKDFILNNCCVKVYKFGAESGMTTSRVIHFKSSVRGRLSDNDGETVLLNQFEVLENYKGKEFAKEGDSGALVMASIDGNLKALGLLTGKATAGRIIVTPIYAILDVLRLSQRRFLAFHHQTATQVSTDSGIHPGSPTDTLDSIHQAMSQEIAEHSHENKNMISAEMRPRFEAIEKDVTDLKTKVTGLDTKITNIDSHVTNLDTKIETKVSAIDSEIKDMSSNMMNMFSKVLEKLNSK